MGRHFEKLTPKSAGAVAAKHGRPAGVATAARAVERRKTPEKTRPLSAPSREIC